MATITRQDILNRFREVSLADCPIDSKFSHFPCMSEASCNPEPEGVSVDFELIVNQLEDQNKQKKEYHEKKIRQKKEFHKKFVRNKEQIEKDVRDEENFQIVTNDQRRKFVNKKKNKKQQIDPKKKKSDLKNPKEAPIEKKLKKKVSQTARGAEKGDSDSEVKPFPDFLGLQGDEEVKAPAPKAQKQAKPATKATAPAEAAATEPAQAEPKAKKPKTQTKKKAEPVSAAAPAEPEPTMTDDWNLEAVIGTSSQEPAQPAKKEVTKASDKLRNRKKGPKGDKKADGKKAADHDKHTDDHHKKHGDHHHKKHDDHHHKKHDDHHKKHHGKKADGPLPEAHQDVHPEVVVAPPKPAPKKPLTREEEEKQAFSAAEKTAGAPKTSVQGPKPKKGKKGGKGKPAQAPMSHEPVDNKEAVKQARADKGGWGDGMDLEGVLGIK